MCDCLQRCDILICTSVMMISRLIAWWARLWAIKRNLLFWWYITWCNCYNCKLFETRTRQCEERLLLFCKWSIPWYNNCGFLCEARCEIEFFFVELRKILKIVASFAVFHLWCTDFAQLSKNQTWTIMWNLRSTNQNESKMTTSFEVLWRKIQLHTCFVKKYQNEMWSWTTAF